MTGRPDAKARVESGNVGSSEIWEGAVAPPRPSPQYKYRGGGRGPQKKYKFNAEIGAVLGLCLQLQSGAALSDS